MQLYANQDKKLLHNEYSYFQWTSDQDITDAVQSIGVTDFAEVKFFENRANGQSKGFCVISLGSEQSMRICMERLPKKELHGQNPVVTFPTKQALNQVCIIVHYDTNKKKKAVAAYADSTLRYIASSGHVGLIHDIFLYVFSV